MADFINGIGHFRKWAEIADTSAYTHKADQQRTSRHVSFVPLSDIRIVERMTVFSGEVLEILPALPLDSRGLSPLSQRTSIFASWAKRLITRDGRENRIVIPWSARFG